MTLKEFKSLKVGDYLYIVDMKKYQLVKIKIIHSTGGNSKKHLPDRLLTLEDPNTHKQFYFTYANTFLNVITTPTVENIKAFVKAKKEQHEKIIKAYNFEIKKLKILERKYSTEEDIFTALI